MKLFRTIRGRMMVCYTCVIMLTVLVMSLIYYRQTAVSLESQASKSLLQLAINNNSNLDAVIAGMDDTANRIISSALIKDAFYEDAGTTALLLQNKRRLLDLLFTVNGSKITNQINLISAEGKFVEFGRNFELSVPPTSPLLTCPWMASCLEEEGKTYLVSPRPYEWGREDRTVFSVCRAFNRTFGAPYDAAVEVLLDYDILARVIQSAVRPEVVSACVYDARGQLIYPLEDAEHLPDYWSFIPAGSSDGVIPVESDRGNEMVAYHSSTYSGLTMVITEGMDDLLAPVRAFRNKVALIGLLFLAVTFVVTFILSQQLTEPIRSIQRSISELELGDLRAPDTPQHPASAYELDKLNRSYGQMVARLQNSLEEAVTARSHATQARILALQSQMNPHFLYNTITVISIKAEDSDDTEVVAMCECLSGMLRYVTRDTSAVASMREELDYLDQYLYLMRCRYPNRFTTQIDVPEALDSLQLPKLLLQPLVENSFKHAFRTSEPWFLALTGRMEGGNWRVVVTDNGVGFPEEVLRELCARFAATSGDFQSTDAGHIGLTNIFERLRFRYHEHAVFDIENLPEGGCRITVGGTYEDVSGGENTP